MTMKGLQDALRDPRGASETVVATDCLMMARRMLNECSSISPPSPATGPRLAAWRGHARRRDDAERTEEIMPEKETLEAAEQDKREGKAPSTQAGEFVREEIHHVREGKHGARSTKQAIAIGLSKARRAGVKLPTPEKGRVSERTRQSARRAAAAGRRRKKRVSRTRAQATTKVLKREGRSAASKTALARQARAAAKRRGRVARSAAAKRAVRTKGARARSAAARKAARTRARNSG
jgi:hypothetical protein